MRIRCLVPLVLLLAGVPSAWAADWVFLPRATTVDAAAQLHPLVAPDASPRALARRAARGRDDRVEELQRGPDATALAFVVQSGARVRRVSRWLSAVSVDATPEQRRVLEARFGAHSLRPVRSWKSDRLPRVAMRPSASPEDSAYYGPSLGQITQIQVDRLHVLGVYGEGIRALLLDTGFDTSHPAIDHLSVIAEWDFVQDDSSTADGPEDPASQDRHGTGVLSVLAGRAPGDLIGVAPSVEVLLAKTERVDEEVRLEEDAFVAALEWGEALGADLMSASLGYVDFPDQPDSFSYAPEDFDGDTAVTTRAVDDLVALGVVAVVSAGNRGPSESSLMTPADADSVISVGAVSDTGVLTNFSSRGPTADGRIKPEVCARGLATVWAETSGGYGAVSGTSLAAPLVAGSAALLLELHPGWGPGAVRDALMATATGAATPDPGSGWGVVQVEDAAFAIEAPETPLPFRLRSPLDGDVAFGSAVVFEWTPAVDLQAAGPVHYTIEFASDSDFASIVARYEAGSDTLRALSFLPDGKHWWRVLATDADGFIRSSGIRTLTADLLTAAPAPGEAELMWRREDSQQGQTWSLRLGLAGRLGVEVYDLRGRRVRVLRAPAAVETGEIRLDWNGRDAAGGRVARGAYFLRAVLDAPAGRRVTATARIMSGL